MAKNIKRISHRFTQIHADNKSVALHKGAKMNGSQHLHQELDQITETIIGKAYYVYNVLGYGFLEKVYENSPAYKLTQAGLAVEQQKPLTVHFEGVVVGEYFADLVVEGQVIVELKSAKTIGA